MFEGSMDNGCGLPKLGQWAERQQACLEKKKAANHNQMDQLTAGLDMMKLQMEMQQKMKDAETDEEKQEIAMQMERNASGILLRIMWTTTVVDITSAIHETTKMVFFDKSVDKETRKFRAAAVERLGEIWMECPAPKSEGPEKDAAQLYEEAAFAAMVETINRRDESC
jgi:hypothetical protein